MEHMVFFFVPAGAVLALVFAFYQSRKILSFSEGNETMRKISAAIRKGAGAYLKRQYTSVALFFAAMFIILGIMAFMGFLNPFVPVAFTTGGFFSCLSGFIGMKIATSANARTAQAASESLDRGLRVAFSSGTVMSFTVVGLALIDMTIWYLLLRYVFYAGDLDPNVQINHISTAMLTFGMGASSAALFARVGGGIFTKAADVGADLVGKVEHDIPEDDPRNPAVIADNVGDNVGDVAGMGADLYESYVASIVAAVALTVSAGYGYGGVMAPMLMAVLGIIASIIGTFFVHCKETLHHQPLLNALRKGVYISSGLVIAGAFPVIWYCLDCANNPGRIGVYFAVLSGIIAGVSIGAITEYFTSDNYKPTRRLSHAGLTGPATVIIGGISLGMFSTLFPIIIVGASVMFSFFISGGAANYAQGLYGVSFSAVGMLSTLGMTLATDAYGPVADNAGGIAEMAGLPKEVRNRTDALDAVGNTTAATGKGFAIGSAALTALALIVAFIDKVETLIPVYHPGFVLNLSLAHPPVLVGLFIGVMLPFLFSSLTMSAVGHAAQGIVHEVRRQFHEITGLMEGTAEADYGACVDICTRSALREMILPTLIGITSPLIAGICLGINGVVGLLAGATASGFVLAIMMANSGGAWDNAKKHIEAGNYGGKKSEPHKAAVVGDTVGDPFKDTSGPSINILIKLVSKVAILFMVIILRYALIN
ncbi:MAG: sodium-translocating pyrophosphatase [Treponema sp.]|jgi:K(+)-stimulated pyrophosphate-energized sodium pump|nr:sodium-translocating pyrophosphatase [Treponema sp.]